MSLRRSFIWDWVALLALGAVTGSSAQPLPDFSGIWVTDTSRSEDADASMLVIRQTPDALDTVSFTRRRNAYVHEILINPWKYWFGAIGTISAVSRSA
jgi:hypothetical protein